MEYFIGGIMLFGGNFAPQGWEPCEGQLVSIANYAALFSILGTSYGGDGEKTFALPKLASPLPGMTYIICLQGIYPSRA